MKRITLISIWTRLLAGILMAFVSLMAQVYDPVPTAIAPESGTGGGWEIPWDGLLLLAAILFAVWLIYKLITRKPSAPPVPPVRPTPPPPPPVAPPVRPTPPPVVPPAAPAVRGVRIKASPMRGITAGATWNFQAEVDAVGGASTDVKWTAAHGTISPLTGRYTTPDVKAETEETITVASVFDPTKTATVKFMVRPATTTAPPPPPPATLLISPQTITLKAGEKQKFTVTGATEPLFWWLRPAGDDAGKISDDGEYTAPDKLEEERFVTVTAALKSDSTKFVKAKVTLATPNTPPPPPPPPTDPPKADDSNKPPLAGGGNGGNGGAKVAMIAVLTLVGATRLFSAECGDFQTGMPYLATGYTRHFVCDGMPTSASSVSFTDVQTGRAVPGVRVANIRSSGSRTEFNLTVDRNVPASRPNMVVNGQNLGRLLRFYPPDQAGVVDGATEMMRSYVAKQLAARPPVSVSAPVPTKTTTLTKVVVDVKTRSQVADLEGRMKALQSLQSKIKEAIDAGGDEVTLADLQKVAAADPAGFRALIAQYAPVVGTATGSLSNTERSLILYDARKYTNEQIEAELKPVAAKVAKIETDLSPTGDTGKKIARTDTAAKALLQDKLKPKGTSRSSRKEALRAAARLYPELYVPAPKEKPAKKPDSKDKK